MKHLFFLLILFIFILVACDSKEKEDESRHLAPPVEERISCSDNDGGKNYEQQGTVIGRTRNGPFANTDECDGELLVEFYCSNRNPGEDKIDCKTIGKTTCENGKCV